ncbi:MlaD family protein [Aquabacterium parvum]|uniref:MlaD family protein n=1 Tax=Aquabacterium parvum TaxID=70584 RepID=UPI000718D45C|nr:MlaD family protein [Aquabacterium parvum]MBU0914915.1 MCE family protein [Gammaproteobacteria bacterium]
MKKRSVALGAFVVVALALAVVLITALGKGRFFGGGRTLAVVWFDKSVKGLTIGAPVTFRGVPVGQVDAIGVELDPSSLASRMPITLAISTEALSIKARGRRAQREALQSLIDRGLVAQMVTQSLVTGQVMIDLNIAQAPAQAVAQPPEGPLVIPHVGGNFDRLLEQVSELPLKDTVSDVRATMQSVRQLAEEARASVAAIKGDVGRVTGEATQTLQGAGKDFHQVSQQTTATLQSLQSLADGGQRLMLDVQPRVVGAVDALHGAANDVRTSMGELSAWVAPGSPTRTDLDGALRDVARSARSFSALVEDIEEQPNMLIFGRSRE